MIRGDQIYLPLAKRFYISSPARVSRAGENLQVGRYVLRQGRDRNTVEGFTLERVAPSASTSAPRTR